MRLELKIFIYQNQRTNTLKTTTNKTFTRRWAGTINQEKRVKLDNRTLIKTNKLHVVFFKGS